MEQKLISTEVFEATPFDLEPLTQLFNAYRIFYGQEDNTSECMAFLAERMQHNESIIYIAYDDDFACGFVQLYPTFSSVRMKRAWLLNDLYVTETHRRKGIAKLLLDRCKQLCNDTNAAGLILETGRDNKAGNSLYPKEEFSKIEDHNFFWWSAP